VGGFSRTRGLQSNRPASQSCRAAARARSPRCVASSARGATQRARRRRWLDIVWSRCRSRSSRRHGAGQRVNQIVS
jgi:hypothetical protein